MGPIEFLRQAWQENAPEYMRQRGAETRPFQVHDVVPEEPLTDRQAQSEGSLPQCPPGG
jgi:hypothetical protein